MYATLLGSLAVAGRAVVNGEMTLGSWVAVNTWVSQIFVPLNFLGSVYAMIVQSLIDVRNLSELLSESPDLTDEPGAKDLVLSNTNGAATKSKTSDLEIQIDLDSQETTDMISKSYSGAKIDFKDIHFNYPSQPVEKGLKGVSFTVLPGTTTAIVGSTGAGKTTISRLLFRFYDPRLGQVLIDNKDIKKCTQKSVRKLVGNVYSNHSHLGIYYKVDFAFRNRSARYSAL
jgi:ABC-type transport system involved in Fe-S cluster assembly fused permease/ATPase subunit